MKTIGIIGGLSTESTALYYEWLNKEVNQRLGGHHNAKTIISSVDFEEFVQLKNQNDWQQMGVLLAKEAAALERAGADFIILATNTMHKVADQIIAAIQIPFLHLGDATADAILEQGITTIGLLGTQYTMALDFYKGRLADKGLKVLVPNEEDQKEVNRIIYDELCHGVIKDSSIDFYKNAIANLKEQGAEGVILGCTEITMLIQQKDSDLPLFDTTKIHVQQAVNQALEG